jgi:hypothetical protein
VRTRRPRVQRSLSGDRRADAAGTGITAALAVTLPVHVLLVLSGGLAALVLLVYIGIALPPVWSAKPTRRKAAAAVLRQLLNAFTGGDRRQMPARTSSAANTRQASRARAATYPLPLVRGVAAVSGGPDS